jgi:hypothetical protein
VSGSDLDRLPRMRVSTGAGLAVLHLERAESGDRDASIFAQATLDSAQDRVDKTRSSQPRGPELTGHVGNELALVHREGAEVLGLLGALAALLALASSSFAGCFLARGFLLGHEFVSPKCGGVEPWASQGRHAPDITSPIGKGSAFLANIFFTRARAAFATSARASGRRVDRERAFRARERGAKTVRHVRGGTRSGSSDENLTP